MLSKSKCTSFKMFPGPPMGIFPKDLTEAVLEPTKSPPNKKNPPKLTILGHTEVTDFSSLLKSRNQPSSHSPQAVGAGAFNSLDFAAAALPRCLSPALFCTDKDFWGWGIIFLSSPWSQPCPFPQPTYPVKLQQQQRERRECKFPSQMRREDAFFPH